MNSLREGLSAFRKPRYGEITNFPKPDYAIDSKERLDKKRVYVYRTVKEEAGNPLVYYPASGSDPVPLNVFGEDRVIYGSLEESPYFQWIKTGDNLPIHKQEKAVPGLKSVQADAKRSPFSDQKFDVILMHSMPASLNDDFWVRELKRILKDDGIIIIDSDQDMASQREFANRVLSYGFEPHELDLYGGITHANYSRAGKGGIRPVITKKQFLKSLKKGEDVRMRAHEIRVFKNPSRG